jgi:hypothetical protein
MVSILKKPGIIFIERRQDKMVGSDTVTKILEEVTDYRLKQYIRNAAPLYRAGELTLTQISKIFMIDEQRCLLLIEGEENTGNQI